MQSPEEIAYALYGHMGAYRPTQIAFCVTIAAALRAYGAECAAQERERCAQVVVDWPDFRQWTADDCAAAIRALT